MQSVSVEVSQARQGPSSPPAASPAQLPAHQADIAAMAAAALQELLHAHDALERLVGNSLAWPVALARRYLAAATARAARWH